MSQGIFNHIGYLRVISNNSRNWDSKIHCNGCMGFGL